MCDGVGWQDPDCGRQEQTMASGNYKNLRADREEEKQKEKLADDIYILLWASVLSSSSENNHF